MGKATDKVRAEYAEKLAAAERKDSISEMIDSKNIPKPCIIVVSELYGSVASFMYGDEYGQKPVSLDDALAIIRALPPISVTLVRDGSRSFRPSEYVAAAPEEAKKTWESEESVCGIWFDIKWLRLSNSLSHTSCLIANWFSYIENIGIILVHVYLGHTNKIGNIQADRKEYHGGFRYENTRVSIADKMRSIHSATGECVANIPNHILWGRGSDQVPNAITIYYGCLKTADPKIVGESILIAIGK